MPIRIIERPEPCTLASNPSGETSGVIESDAYRQLVHELRRYCNGEISGRSFLIAGHRGAGKTTLVLNAFEKLQSEARLGEARLRPLLILLLGPSLLPRPDETKETRPQSNEKEGKSDKDGKSPVKLSEFENVLVQLTLALYQSVAWEFTSAFRAHLRAKLDFAQRRGNVGGMDGEWMELPSQLELELDEYVGKARLREFWNRAEALDSGVLFSGVEYVFSRAAAEKRLPVPPGQGSRELVALASVCEAYRRISGSISRKNENKSGASDEKKSNIEFDAKGKDLFGPLIALLAGGAVGTGVVTTNPGSYGPAALAGILTALAAAAAGKFTSTRTRQRSSADEDLFMPDLTVATLDRVIPVLLGRLRAVGLAPVFVIDELDKVENPSKRIPNMVLRLKKLVAESAYFCFLTDRSYYEELRDRLRTSVYSMEYTYFSSQLFVAFRHGDIHAYLKKILEEPKPIKPTMPSLGTNLSASAIADENAAIKRSEEEIADWEVLPYVVLHAAHMHPIDLRREISRLRNEGGNVALPVGEVRSLPRCRLELQMQVAIELILNGKEMQWELGRDPAFRRVAHDALYYISREWEDDPMQLQLDAAGQKKFIEYLRKRMATEDPSKTRGGDEKAAPAKTINDVAGAKAIAAKTGNDADSSNAALAKPGNDAAAKSGEDATGANAAATSSPDGRTTDFLPFTREQGKFLWKKVIELAEHLAQPKKIRDLATEQKFPGKVIDALQFEGTFHPFLKQVSGSRKRYVFSYFRSGRSRFPQLMPAATWEQQIAVITEFNNAVLALTGNTIDCGNLASGYGVLATSPAWPIVETAMGRLNKQGKQDYPDKPDDISVVGEYEKLLQRSADLVADALFCGAVIGAFATGTKTNDIQAGLAIVCNSLSLRDTHEEKAQELLKKLAKKIVELTPGQPRPPEGAKVTDFSSIDPWKNGLKTFLSDAAAVRRPLRRDPAAAWRFVYDTFQGTQPEADLDLIISVAEQTGPFAWIHLPIAANTVRQWSALFYEIITVAIGEDESRKDDSKKESAERTGNTKSHPLWLGIGALQQNGLESLAREIFQRATSPTGTTLFRRNYGHSPEENTQIQRWNVAKLDEARRRASAMIITQHRSAIENWEVSKLYGALILRFEEAEKLIGIWQQKQMNGLFAFDAIILDLSLGGHLPPANPKTGGHSAPATRKMKARSLQSPSEALADSITRFEALIQKFPAITPLPNAAQSTAPMRDFGAIVAEPTGQFPSSTWIKPILRPKSLDDMFSLLRPMMAA